MQEYHTLASINHHPKIQKMRAEEVPVNNSYLLAPCGINCGICKAYLRKNKPCLGCNIDSPHKSKSITICSIKNCPSLKAKNSNFCSSCETLPCKRLKQLHQRYSAKYHVNILENLKEINNHGAEYFFASDIQKWTCPQCQHLISMHIGVCANCGTPIQL